MATETDAATTADVSTTTGDWKAGVAGGIAGSAVFGLVMTFVIPAPLLEVAIPSMYGLAPPAAPLAGWFVHVSHGAVIGVAFAALAGAKPGLTSDVATTVGAGAVYGLVVWAVLAVVVMPLWLPAVGSPADPGFPNVGVLSAAGHLLYGVVLSVVYAAAE